MFHKSIVVISQFGFVGISHRVQVKTYPCQNVPNQNVPSFGKNVPTFLVKTYPGPPKRTQPFGQNVPNIFFPDIQYIFFLKSYLHIGQNVPCSLFHNFELQLYVIHTR